MGREFQIFIKPVGALCNLRCSYCYYLQKNDLYPGNRITRMSDDILEKYIIRHIEASTDDVVMFSWHGGEPTLAGLEFYIKAVSLQKKYLPEGRSAINGIQTNGTLLDDEWCDFFARENFIVGISIDGPDELHNRYRRFPDGKGSLSQVLRGYEFLQKHKVTTEILCVVNSHNVGYPLVIYDFFRQLEARFITFLPLVEHDPGSPSGASKESVPAEEFGAFLCSVFDNWIENDIGRIKVQIFEEAARTAFDREHTLCIFKVNCGGVPVTEHNGDFYSCDHYVDKEHLLGNIIERSIVDILESPEQISFGKAKFEKLPRYCIECPVKEMCNGECPKNRFITTPDGEPGLNYLCNGYRLFFTHCRPFVEALRTAWLNDQNDQ
ncbi:MAG: anaerobic sulfatase maturase [Bacteroidales bacterium]|nr:anaerobic sulfatase maturase [Bacteroidales bacterium]